jgi:oligopeptide/dipeptide ABC transporter ATP-binding protein
MADSNGKLLRVEGLKTHFPIKRGLLRRTIGHIKAVDGVDFCIDRAQTFGIVGESGCGKTTVARSIIRLVKPTSGEVLFKDRDVLTADKKQLLELRKQISIIFQDPYGSLNPRMTVANIIGEPMKAHGIAKGLELRDRVAHILRRVGLSPDYMNRYPHEFSGGQRQRIGVARALALEPELVICDEPVSALDVSIRAQILNLLKDLQEEFNLTLLFIAHDLAVVQFLCDVVAVMYLGRIIELAESEVLYKNPCHPYTKTLMAAIPRVDPTLRGRGTKLKGEVPSIAKPPRGCPFHPRCPVAEDRCKKEEIPFNEVSEGHLVRCFKTKPMGSDLHSAPGSSRL